MRGTAAERTGPWVKDTAAAEFRIAALLRVVGVVADEEVPAHRRVLRSERMKGRHIIISRESFTGFTRVAARFEQYNMPAGFGEAGRDRAATSAGSDDNVIAISIAPPHHLMRDAARTS